MLATGETVGLAAWIIDNTRLFLFGSGEFVDFLTSFFLCLDGKNISLGLLSVSQEITDWDLKFLNHLGNHLALFHYLLEGCIC